MQKYKTRQRKLLLEHLAAHADEELSARQIENALREYDISLSAVYRNLSIISIPTAADARIVCIFPVKNAERPTT